MFALPKAQLSTFKKTLSRKRWELKQYLGWKAYFAVQRIYKRLGLYSNFEVKEYNTSPDKALAEWKRFSGAVTCFGEADGFASIHTTEYKYDLSGCLHLGWQYYNSPEHFLEILEDGTEVDLTDIEAADKFELEEDFSKPLRERIYWIVEAKAGLVCCGSIYQVRHGFWTRIVSENLEKAIKRTIQLWEQEHRKPDSIKLREEAQTKSRESYLKHLAYEGWSDAWILDTESVEDNLKGAKIEDAYTAMKLYTLVEDLDIKASNLRELILKLLKPYYEELRGISERVEETRKRSAKADPASKYSCVSWEAAHENMELRDELLKKLDKVIKKCLT